MKYCNRCLYPENHALNILFDDDGICSGCRTHEEKYEIDWNEKALEIGALLSKYKNRKGSSYDCVIPVSGTGDDFFVVDTIKNRYGLNPLLVTYNTHFSTKVGIRNLARLISELDCDHMMSTVGPETVKNITRTTLEKIGDMYWHVLAGSQTFPVQVATKLEIPLIIWGVNGWLDQVGMYSHHDRVEMTKKVRKEHALRCLDAECLLGENPLISAKDLQAFTYPSDEQLERSKVRGIYLGNYLFWDSKAQVESMIAKFGYESCLQERTYNSYESIYCSNNAGVHDYIKYLKYGYCKVHDHVARDIRLKRLSRKDGLERIEKYRAIKPSSLNQFLSWADISEKDFYRMVDRFRDPSAWSQNADGEWLLTADVCRTQLLGEDYPVADNANNDYVATPLMETQQFSDEYHLMGRTYMDDLNYKAVEG